MYYKVLLALFLCILVFVNCTSVTKSLSISPSIASFGEVNLGDSEDITLTLKNNYRDNITVGDLIIDGTSDFFIKGTVAPFNIPTGTEYNLVVSFKPSDGVEIEGLLRILHSGSLKDKVVKLKGVGVPVARISLSDSSYDFYKVLNGTTKTKDFEIENFGTSVLEIDSLTITGHHSSLFTIISGGNLPINIDPQDKHSITVQFAPNANGNYTASVDFHHNAVNENENLSISLDGIGTDIDAEILLSKSTPWDFGLVATTLPSIQFVEIDNGGTDKLELTSATLTNNSEFTIESLLDSNGANVNFPYEVQAGSYVLLRIKFAPTTKTTFADTLTIVHNAHNEYSPYNIDLSGEGRDILTKTFSFSGVAENWVVPSDVTSIIVECYGAEGGPSEKGSTPGKGGLAKATVSTTPGETIYVYVGGKGSVQKASPTGGWNGGGGTDSSFTSFFPGTGGGASDIRIGGQSLSDRKVVGGGGGGGGHSTFGGIGGDAGGLIGDNGQSTSSTNYPPGDGGTQIAGGKGGFRTTSYYAEDGQFGLGGRGKGYYSGGGGGGAGWYGGGGGCIGAGGGGSSYYDATGNTNTSTQKGVRSGDGEILIKY